MPPRGYSKYGRIDCQVEGCTDKAKYSGLCGMHYKRQWRYGDVNTSIIPHNFVPSICEVPDCNEPTYASNTTYCKLHYQRLYRYGRLENIKSKYGTGSYYIDSNGYKVVTIDGVTKHEHVHLAEKALGKPLPPGAVVHHMNRNPGDNYTPFNLIICPDQAYHLLLHRRMRELDYNPEPPDLALDL